MYIAAILKYGFNLDDALTNCGMLAISLDKITKVNFTFINIQI